MNTINLDDITVSPNRQRKLFTDESLNELADSIEARGLLHPIVLRDDRKTLVSGERRMRAARLLSGSNRVFHHCGEAVPLGHVPYTNIGALPERECRLAELEENTIRIDLTWQERVTALAELDAELDALARDEGRPHTLKETSEKAFGSPGGIERVSRARTIAAHLDDPAVAKAPDEKSAMKVVARRLEQEFLHEMAQRGETRDSPHVLVRGDLIDELPRLESGSFDVIIADPPYGIEADKFGDQAQLDHEYDDSRWTAIRLYGAIASEGYRITKPQAHAYVFLDIGDNFDEEYDPDNVGPNGFEYSRFQDIAMTFRYVGWSVWRTPLIWYKGTSGLAPRPQHGPRRSYEAILFASKGDRPVTGMYDDTILTHADRLKDHAAQKPVDLYVNLLQRSVRPGDTVLDPCCGSGTVFPAADALHVQATGIEKDEGAWERARGRLAR